MHDRTLPRSSPPCPEPIAARIAFALAATALATPAAAHHPLGGDAPDSVVHGLLSGIGHPIIGLDHLAFLLGAALLAAFHGPRSAGATVAYAVLFAAAGAFGTLGRTVTPGLAAIEMLVAATLVTVGVASMIGRRPGSRPTAFVVAIAGAIHGYAFGEAIVGAQTAPLLAYLAGLAATQGALLVLAFVAGRWVVRELPGRVRVATLATAVATTAVGIAFAARAAADMIAG
jgi:urease accessory protein